MRISDWSSDVCSSDLIRDRYELEAGLRYDYKYLDALGYDRELRLYGGTRQFHNVSASLGGVWRPAPGWDFRSNLGMAWRPPSVNELYSNGLRSEEHTSELQSLMRISYAVFCLKKKNNKSISEH